MPSASAAIERIEKAGARRRERRARRKSLSTGDASEDEAEGTVDPVRAARDRHQINGASAPIVTPPALTARPSGARLVTLQGRLVPARPISLAGARTGVLRCP